MHKIYAGGCMTLVWLGEATEYTRDLCQILDAAGREPLDFTRTRKYPSDEDLSKIEKTIISLEKDVASHAVPLDYYAVRGDLWTRAWFTRGWILQEIAHSTKVIIVIGSFVFAQNDLKRMIRAALHHESVRHGDTKKNDENRGAVSYLNIVHFDRVFGENTWAAFGPGPPTLHRNLEERIYGLWTGSTLVSDPRDIIYAFLNISAKEPIFFATPDYTLSVAGIFAKATRYFIHDTERGRLDIMQHFGGILSKPPERYWTSNSGKENLPSWSFDWGSWCPFRPLSGGGHLLDLSPYSADNNRQIGLALYDFDTLGTLGVKGKIISTVAYSSQSFPKVDTRLNPSKDCLELDFIASELNVYHSSLNQSETPNPGFHPSSEVQSVSLSNRNLLKILSLGTISNGYDPRIKSGAENWDSFSAEQKLAHVFAKYENELYDDIDGVLNIARNRCAFIDTEQRLGVGSEGMQAGDCIAIIHGSSTPILLRKKADSHQYLFAGPCYLEGAMFGEAVTWDEEDADAIELC